MNADTMAGYERALVDNMGRPRYQVKSSRVNGCDTRVVFFKRPGGDGIGFENDETALKNIIRSHEKTNSQLCEPIAAVFDETDFQVYWNERFLADHARKAMKKCFGKRAAIIGDIPTCRSF
jgi:hypothetical protein